MNTNTAGATAAGEPSAASTPSRTQDANLGNLAAMLDVPLRLTVELGRAELPLAEVLALKPGSVVELDRFPGEPLDMYANGRLIARGEIIVLNDIFGFRVTDIPSATTETAAGG
ncbi:MAG: flagellar motor switch protein FliN [Armatimonadota bacterium]